MFRAYIHIVFFSFSFLSFSQFNETDILFSVNDEPVLAGEFIRVYNKNIDLVEDEKILSNASDDASFLLKNDPKLILNENYNIRRFILNNPLNKSWNEIG